MYVSVVFVIRCLYSALSLILVRGQRFVRMIDYFYYCYLSAVPVLPGHPLAALGWRVAGPPGPVQDNFIRCA